jgi:hypothetical protein
MKKIKYYSIQDYYPTPYLPQNPWDPAIFAEFSSFSSFWTTVNIKGRNNVKATVGTYAPYPLVGDEYGMAVDIDEDDEDENQHRAVVRDIYKKIKFLFYKALAPIFEFFLQESDILNRKPSVRTLLITFHLSTTLHHYIELLICLNLLLAGIFGFIYYVNFTFFHDVQFEQ